jgi:hypothetical protein
MLAGAIPAESDFPLKHYGRAAFARFLFAAALLIPALFGRRRLLCGVSLGRNALQTKKV